MTRDFSQGRAIRILIFLLYFAALSFLVKCNTRLDTGSLSNTERITRQATVSSDIRGIRKQRFLQKRKRKSFSRCGLNASHNFKTWFGSLSTDAPVLFPSDDDELAEIITMASSNGCKVRIRGAGHSEDGVVTQLLEENVVVLSLRDYYPPKESSWNGTILENVVPSGEKKSDTIASAIRMRAGASFLELMSLIRPQGYHLISGTVGRFFTLGGVFVNPSCMGNMYTESRLATQLTAVRVMDGFGEVHEYSGNEVLDFRGSMGLLGVVTAVEIQIRRDTGLTMHRESLVMSNDDDFKRVKVQEFFNQTLINNDGTTFMFWSHFDEIMAFNTRLTGGNVGFDRVATQEWYDAEMARTPDLAYNGGTFWRYPGSQYLYTASSIVAAQGKELAKLAQGFLRTDFIDDFDEAKEFPNDGFFFKTGVPNYEQVYYSIRCQDQHCLSDMVDVLDITRTFLRDQHENPLRLWVEAQLMWRVFNVHEGEMTLEHMRPGKYIGIELHVSRMRARNVYAEDLERLDRLWRESFPGGGIHHGKAYAYGLPGGARGRRSRLAYPFQNDTILDSIYDAEVRSRFVSKMDEYDPGQVFRAGAVLRLLGLTDNKYVPQQKRNP